MTLSIPSLKSGCTVLEAALAYAKCGWYVGPVKHGTKHPGSVLGDSWQHKTSREAAQLAEWFYETDYGVFLHAGRSGAVIFDLDHPEKIPPVLAAAIAEDHPPVQATRLVDPTLTLQRGHYLFACPPGRAIGNSTGDLGKGWGEVRGLNGVIIAAPSQHPNPDGCYAWLSGGVVPVLRALVADMVPDGEAGVDVMADAAVAALMASSTGDGRPGGLRGPLKRWAVLLGQGASRHDAAVEAACWIARESLAGWYPLRPAMAELRELFIDAMGRPLGGGRIIPEPRAKAEFKGIVAWALAQAGKNPERITQLTARLTEADPYELGAFDEVPDVPSMDDDDEFECAGAPERVSVINGYSPEPAEEVTALSIPSEFWNARPVLQHIRQFAHSRACGADMVLLAVLARISAMVPHYVRFDSKIKSPGSLNLFVTVVGKSGSGKSSGADVAVDLIETPAWLEGQGYRELSLGSGEGLAEAYMGLVEEESQDLKADGTPKKGRMVKKMVRHNLFAWVDEGQTLTIQSARAGATIGPTIRSAWVGSMIGQANATEERTRLLPARSYSLGLLIGFQKTTAQPFLSPDEEAAGTPQRFLWTTVQDPYIPSIQPADPGQVRLAIPYSIMDDGEVLISIDKAITDKLWDVAIANIRKEREGADLDSHQSLMLLKVSSLLAILDGRMAVTREDWKLARMLWKTSCAVRDETKAYGVDAVERENDARNDAAVTRAVLTQVAVIGADKTLTRIATVLAKKIHDDGPQTPKDLRHRLAYRDRGMFDAALEYAIGQGWITATPEKVSPGVSLPAPL